MAAVDPIGDAGRASITERLPCPLECTGIRSSRRRRGDISRRIAGICLQELNAILHLPRREDLGNQHRASDEQPDGRIGGREQDACVGHSSGVQAQMIGIGGNQNPAVRVCKREQRGV